MTTEREPVQEPLRGGATSLEIAAWHLQALLAAISGSDGKIMFLTALNVAGMSALIGVAVTSDPTVWLLGLGFAVSGVCIAMGLSRLWAADVRQFPTPTEALHFARDMDADADALAWRHFFAVQAAAIRADRSLRRRSRLTRTLLIGTIIALTVVVAAALSTPS